MENRNESTGLEWEFLVCGRWRRVILVCGTKCVKRDCYMINSFLTDPGKYRLQSMASLVTASVHASNMSKLQKEMYPSLWVNCEDGQASAIYYYWKKLALPDISYYLSQGRYLLHICIVRKEVSTIYMQCTHLMRVVWCHPWLAWEVLWCTAVLPVYLPGDLWDIAQMWLIWQHWSVIQFVYVCVCVCVCVCVRVCVCLCVWCTADLPVYLPGDLWGTA